MRTKPATRYNAESEHASYGIVNWFHGKGIRNQEVMKETMGNFCIENGFKDFSKKTKESAVCNFCQNRFNSFSQFAINFLKENNYL